MTNRTCKRSVVPATGLRRPARHADKGGDQKGERGWRRTGKPATFLRAQVSRGGGVNHEREAVGTRGPVGKPPELKLLEGGRGNRPIDLSAIFRPEVGLPAVPKHLNAGARKAWKRITPELLRYNLLSRLDSDALAMLCQTIARIELVETSFNKRQALLIEQGKDAAESLLGQTPNGMLVQHPLYQVLNREMDKLRNLLAEFGLTPAQRARVTPAIRAQQQLFDANGQPGKPAEPAKPAGFADFN